LGDDDLSPPMKNSPERTKASISACYDRGILDFGDQLITAKTYHAWIVYEQDEWKSEMLEE